MDSLSDKEFSKTDKEMYLIIIFIILINKPPNTQAACAAERNANINQMRIQRPDPGMYYAVDTSKRRYDVSGCPSGTIPSTFRDLDEYWDHNRLNQGNHH